MSIFKHTPGPWKDGIGPDGEPVVFQTSIQARAFDGAYGEQHRANCLLLDSAPEMLDFLVELEKNWRIDEETQRRIRVLIQKATTL